jgi:hypothetical protein
MLTLRSFAVGSLCVALAGSAFAAEPAKPAPANPAKPAAVAPSPHHKGMLGESSPHNGWARYGRLRLDIGSDRYFVYDQTPAEFSATVIDRQSEAIKIRGVSIPGAGLFYYPSEASPCEPDAMERVGLYAELLLFYLSSAFPAGPASIDASSSGVVDRPIPELHFMNGRMKAHEGARTLVTAAPVAAGQIQYLLQDDKDKIKGVWEASRNRAVIPDDEPLLGWNTCWAGTWSTRADGGSSFKPALADATSLKTFGEVRRARRASRRPASK